MKYWYPESKFPPVYFAMGVFTSGGTVTENGLIIGTEMLNNLDGLPGLIAHELIHFQQKFGDSPSLLNQSILEGSADFIGELISGEHINMKAFNYGRQHEGDLCTEFIKVMNDEDYNDWLYSTTEKDDRPNDLGYWMGYKIVESYFNNHSDKHKAIFEILHVQDAQKFLKKSGYLDEYLKS